MPRIGIVGGGPGGLMTAYFLQQRVNRPIDVTIFEASERLGGKILTPRFASAPIAYEAGAAEFYGYSHIDEDPLEELIAELGLPTAPMSGNSVYIDGRFLGNLDDVERHFGPAARTALKRFHGRARDQVSPVEYYLSGSFEPTMAPSEARRFDVTLGSIPEAATRRFVEVLIHSDLATEPAGTSAEYGLHNYLMNDPAYLHLYGIVGGNEWLIRRLAERIRAEVRFRQRVTRIERGETRPLRLAIAGAHTGADVEPAASRERDAYEFDFVIAALPHDALSTVEFQGDRLAEALRRHLSHHDYPAHYLRITILFRRPFWAGRMVDSFCMLDAFGGCCLYDESSRVAEPTWGVLGWLLGGETAVEHARLTDGELVGLALDSLPAEFGDGRAYFVEGRVHRWLGAVNAIPGGIVPLPLDVRHQPEPIEHSRLFVVGDYLYDSTINGVLDSADYVANWVAARIHDDEHIGTSGAAS